MAKARKKVSPAVPKAGFDTASLDALIGEAKTAEDVELLFRQMKKALMERILSGELTHHFREGDQTIHAPGSTVISSQHRGKATDFRVAFDPGSVDPPI